MKAPARLLHLIDGLRGWGWKALELIVGATALYCTSLWEGLTWGVILTLASMSVLAGIIWIF